jgi:hypothetical protein
MHDFTWIGPPKDPLKDPETVETMANVTLDLGNFEG